jgi:hypothetical protein
VARPQVVLDHDVEVAAGGVFVPGCDLPLGTECELIAGELVVAARVVFVDPRGAGLELVDPARLDQLAASRTRAPNLHERLRGLTLVEQIKRAQKGEVSERIVLERIYGKTVWEPLLRNPRITGPEVARIARMGALPRPMIELICGNGTWLQIPEIRRALLGNPRLGTDQILRVLRLLPRHELALATKTTAYPLPVRDAAKRLLRELDGRVK